MTSLRTVVLMFAPTLAIISLESFCLLRGDPCSVPHGVLAPFEGSPFPNLLSCFSVFDYSGLFLQHLHVSLRPCSEFLPAPSSPF